MLPASVAVAFLALWAGWVRFDEVPRLLDYRLLSLFFVLITAVDCAVSSRLFDWLVRRILLGVRTSRSLAVAAVLTTGLVSATVTNDVALLHIVPFTMTFARADAELPILPIVILEISAANLLGCLTPTGNPQNLFLFTHGGFTAGSFVRAQLPWVAAMTVATLAAVWPLVARQELPVPEGETPVVEPVRATTFGVLLALAVLAVFRVVPGAWPALAALPALGLLGWRRVLRIDFSLVVVFAALFVGVEGIRRSPIGALLDPIRLTGVTPRGFAAGGALLSQLVSNVPAALLLAPRADLAGGGALFVGLLYGVNAGGCGTPISSLANLIGARLYLLERDESRRFWVTFTAVSVVLLIVGVLVSVLLLGSG